MRAGALSRCKMVWDRVLSSHKGRGGEGQDQDMDRMSAGRFIFFLSPLWRCTGAGCTDTLYDDMREVGKEGRGDRVMGRGGREKRRRMGREGFTKASPHDLLSRDWLLDHDGTA